MKLNNQSMSNWLVSGAVVLALLVVGRDFFVPLVFALLLWAVINAMVSFLERQKIPPFMAWSAAFAMIILSIWFVALILADQASAVATDLPKLAQKVEVLIQTKLPFHVTIPALDVSSLAQNESVRGFLGMAAASIGTCCSI